VSLAAWITLVVVCGSVWGGFAALLARAILHERRRARPPGRPRSGDAA
jgi:hypothetical protein